MSIATSLTLTRHAEVSTVLADARFAVPTEPARDGTGMGWLRAATTRVPTPGRRRTGR